MEELSRKRPHGAPSIIFSLAFLGYQVRAKLTFVHELEPFFFLVCLRIFGNELSW